MDSMSSASNTLDFGKVRQPAHPRPGPEGEHGDPNPPKTKAPVVVYSK